ncbi:MAG: lecithin retinol acyltransferase family protein [Cyanobacteria bacterium P01_D01_bin.105]
MARGDQVYAFREIVGIPYEHHGIDCGDGTIIHYSKIGEAQISRTPRATFARGGTVYTKAVSTALISDIVVQRAESRLGERQYDLFFNNCEHFADWCKTGGGKCAQLDNFGLRLGQIKLSQARSLANRSASSAPQEPQQAMALFQAALENIAIATTTLLPQYEQARKDMVSWHRVAQSALKKDREDLARAALHKKVAAKKEASQLKEQLNQLSALQLNLEQNQAFMKKQSS